MSQTTLPIGTIPGLVSALVGIDIRIAPSGDEGTMTRVFMRHTDFDNGFSSDTTVIGAIHNAPGGGGDSIPFQIPDQTQSVLASGLINFTTLDDLYLRVTSAGSSMNLTGWVETSLTGAGAVTVGLTNLVNVKQYLKITSSTHDVLLQDLIDAVSEEIQGWLRRPIAAFTETDEKGDVWGSDEYYLNRYPIISVTSLAEGSATLVDGTDFEHTQSDDRVGRLVRMGGGVPMSWASGNRNIVATYDHGYNTIPPQITQAANELVAFDWYGSAPGGGRLGLDGKALDSGGTSGYISRQEAWQAQIPRLTPFIRKD